MSKKFNLILTSLLLITITLALFGVYFWLQNVKRERVLSAWRKEAQLEVSQNEAERVAADQAKKANYEIQRTNDEVQKANAEVQGRRQEEASAKTQEKNKNGEWERFFSGFDVTLADKTVPFSDSKSGISFILPYRETWDIDPDHPLEPYTYEETDFSFSLVPRQYPGAGSFNWLFGLSIMPTGNFSVSNGKVVDHSVFAAYDIPSHKAITINGFQVIKGMTAKDGLCGGRPFMAVLGRQYDYFFAADCVMSQSDELRYEDNAYLYLETIIKTIKLSPGF